MKITDTVQGNSLEAKHQGASGIFTTHQRLVLDFLSLEKSGEKEN